MVKKLTEWTDRWGEREWNRLLNSKPTFEHWAWLKKLTVTRSVRKEGAEHAPKLQANLWPLGLVKKLTKLNNRWGEGVENDIELQADFWARGLVKKIDSDPIGQEQVEHAIRVQADFWASGLVKKLTKWTDRWRERGWKMLLNSKPTFELRACLKKLTVTRSVKSKWNMLLNYRPTFEPWAWLKIDKVNWSVGREGVEDATELQADFWAPGLVKKIDSNPIGQEQV